MQYTTHYNLMLPEGTDTVNPLVQQNPNFSDIDAAMYANKQGVVGSATELTAGTVHTITRANPDSNVFRFTATSNWTAGDSMVIDSTPVSVYLSDGTVPATGAYVINTEVIGVLSGSRVTLIISSGIPNADKIFFNNAGTGLSATNAEDAIKEVNRNSVYKAGDVISLPLVTGTGVSNTSGILTIPINLAKPTTANNVSISATVTWIRGNGNTMAGSVNSIAIANESQLSVALNMDTPDNYQTYAAALTNVTITFA